MLIRSYDTGLALSPAPEFSSDGLWPPTETEWLPVRWELFEAHAPATDSSTWRMGVARSKIVNRRSQKVMVKGCQNDRARSGMKIGYDMLEEVGNG